MEQSFSRYSWGRLAQLSHCKASSALSAALDIAALEWKTTRVPYSESI